VRWWEGDILVGVEDVEAVHDVHERCRLVLLPLLDRLGTVDHDDEIIVGALVVDLDYVVVCANLGCC